MPTITVDIPNLITNNKNRQITLSTDSGFSFTGYLKDDFGFGTSAQYKSVLEGLMPGKISNIMSSAGAWLNAFGMGINDSNVTRKSWTNSDTGSMTFNIRVISLTPETNVVAIAKEMLKTTLPVPEGKIVLKAPLGYQALEGTSAVSIMIGNWFRTTSSHVVNQCTVTFSKVQLKGASRPLYADFNITLEPKMTFNYQEVQAWFVS